MLTDGALGACIAADQAAFSLALARSIKDRTAAAWSHPSAFFRIGVYTSAGGTFDVRVEQSLRDRFLNMEDRRLERDSR